MKNIFLLTTMLFTFLSVNIMAQNEEPFFVSVAQMPEFQNGQSSLSEFFQKNLVYPQEAIDANIEGAVIASFIVEKDGSVSNINIIRGLGHGCDKEVIRLIKIMPKWTPGKKDGKPVRVKLNIPVKFSLT